jgi:hypothetical protein
MGFQKPFPARYEVEILDLVPEDARTFGRERPSQGGDVIVAVRTDRMRWVGVARAGPPSLPKALFGVLSTPSPLHLCVVARGDAYLIDVLAPDRYELVDTAGPVVQAKAVPDEGVLLLVSPWTITALEEKGVRWRTDRLAIEGIRLDEVQGGWLAGVADPDDDEPRDFCVNLRTGRHEGGVPFG